MKARVIGWQDTGNVDLILEPENDGEKALLVLLRARTPRWSEGKRGDDKEEIIFPPLAGPKS